ncbi:MAG: hypothetical protein CMI30_10360 [Opitutae bacterium]|nr:hypothetical protein [Opitutae bacterium]|tara:strand:- start:1431 stop:2156 length:726 start_codon:yes stop_codon:yes gene_type:complete
MANVHALNQLLGVPTDVGDYRYWDLSFPPIQTPPPATIPYLPKRNYEWVKGIDIPVGSKGAFKHPWWAFVNKRYPLQTSRLIASWETSYCYCKVNLGGGYWLLSSPMDPDTLSTRTNKAFYICFLYQLRGYSNRGGGTRRLAGFIKYLSGMPRCPFTVVYFRPTGDELLSVMAPHLSALGYRRTGHKTADLKRIYSRMLKGKPTRHLDDFGEPYWRSDLFQPTDSIYGPKDCPWPRLLQNA